MTARREEGGRELGHGDVVVENATRELVRLLRVRRRIGATGRAWRGPVAEELREIVKGKYVELKLEPKPSAASVMPSMREQMKAVEIS